jgi:inhibitor of KinA
VVPAYDTLGVYFDPEKFSVGFLEEALAKYTPSAQVSPGREHQVPVCYELGEDLEASCRELGMSASEFVTWHCSRPYLCYAIGFAPGFPYLGYLPEAISGLSRLPSPRIHVPAGAVGVTNDQTGIYPGGRPGGWRLVGATPLETVNVEDAFFPISAGDWVAFYPVTQQEYESRRGERL